uniref:Uncharacterized protein n=1 Tax=Trypanosoma vivax (strain Y486) TaxID=1055687 RepID=G0TXP2_TRYVY|nr:hypothetical protein TVY486_0700760 [Trypanosoma vivax Y486]
MNAAPKHGSETKHFLNRCCRLLTRLLILFSCWNVARDWARWEVVISTTDVAIYLPPFIVFPKQAFLPSDTAPLLFLFVVTQSKKVSASNSGQDVVVHYLIQNARSAFLSK